MTKKLPILSLAATLAVVGFCVHAACYSGQKSEKKSAADAKPQPAAEKPREPAKKDSAKGKNGDKKIEELPESAEAKKLFSEARDRLYSYQTIKANIREITAIGDRQIVATGTLVRGENLKLRIEFQVKLPEENAPTGGLLQVCDGQILFTRESVNNALVRMTRRDVRKILAAADKSKAIDKNLLEIDLGLGGLPALLASLEKSMRFNAVREETIQGAKFTVVEGTWRAQLMESFHRVSGSPDRLPGFVPDTVRVYFDPKTLFPRRIMYLKKDSARKFSRPMVTLDFLDVVLNSPVDDDSFHFVPEKGELAHDLTNTYLGRLEAAAAGPKPVDPEQPPMSPSSSNPNSVETPPSSEPPKSETKAP